ncbi:predicted protein, partial [Nematostella vectensis]
PTPCPIHRYRDIPGGEDLDDCFKCPAGYWCNVTGMNNYNNSACPLGHYCLSAQVPQLCEAGTRRKVVGARNQSDCSPCPGGQYCPYNETNIDGIPCRPKYFCREGAKYETYCPAGRFCNYTTAEPYICPGGHYCPNGSDTYTPCEYPYYCPPGSGFPKLCDLGHFALTKDKPRASVEANCQICRAGTYGNHPERLNCTICPPGYFCPAGTIGPHKNPCPLGHFCPEGSGDKNPCSPGHYGDRELATSPSDCKKCSAGDFNDQPGGKACLRCGSSSTSDVGAATCTCIGKFRSFQLSDRSCICQSGYVCYNEDLTVLEGNSEKDCQPENLGTCLCNYDTVNCDTECQANKPTIVIRRNELGKLEYVVSNGTTSTTTINRSLSHYPRYRKNHLFNTNPDFDFGTFRELHSVVTETNKTLSFFVHAFKQAGVFVFYDNAVPMRETVVSVMDIAQECPGNFTMGPLSEGTLSTLGVGQAQPKNLAPNWTVI